MSVPPEGDSVKKEERRIAAPPLVFRSSRSPIINLVDVDRLVQIDRSRSTDLRLPIPIS